MHYKTRLREKCERSCNQLLQQSLISLIKFVSVELIIDQQAFPINILPQPQSNKEANLSNLSAYLAYIHSLTLGQPQPEALTGGKLSVCVCVCTDEVACGWV